MGTQEPRPAAAHAVLSLEQLSIETAARRDALRLSIDALDKAPPFNKAALARQVAVQFFKLIEDQAALERGLVAAIGELRGALQAHAESHHGP